MNVVKIEINISVRRAAREVNGEHLHGSCDRAFGCTRGSCNVSETKCNRRVRQNTRETSCVKRCMYSKHWELRHVTKIGDLSQPCDPVGVCSRQARGVDGAHRVGSHVSSGPHRGLSTLSVSVQTYALHPARSLKTLHPASIQMALQFRFCRAQFHRSDRATQIESLYLCLCLSRDTFHCAFHARTRCLDMRLCLCLCLYVIIYVHFFFPTSHNVRCWANPAQRAHKALFGLFQRLTRRTSNLRSSRPLDRSFARVRIPKVEDARLGARLSLLPRFWELLRLHCLDSAFFLRSIRFWPYWQQAPSPVRKDVWWKWLLDKQQRLGRVMLSDSAKRIARVTGQEDGGALQEDALRLACQERPKVWRHGGRHPEPSLGGWLSKGRLVGMQEDSPLGDTIPYITVADQRVADRGAVAQYAPLSPGTPQQRALTSVWWHSEKASTTFKRMLVWRRHTTSRRIHVEAGPLESRWGASMLLRHKTTHWQWQWQHSQKMCPTTVSHLTVWGWGHDPANKRRKSGRLMSTSGSVVSKDTVKRQCVEMSAKTTKRNDQCKRSFCTLENWLCKIPLYEIPRTLYWTMMTGFRSVTVLSKLCNLSRNCTAQVVVSAHMLQTTNSTVVRHWSHEVPNMATIQLLKQTETHRFTSQGFCLSPWIDVCVSACGYARVWLRVT